MSDRVRFGRGVIPSVLRRLEAHRRNAKDLPPIEDESYIRDSFFSFGGRQFSETSAHVYFASKGSDIMHEDYGWLSIAIFEPQVLGREKLRHFLLPVWEGAQVIARDPKKITPFIDEKKFRQTLSREIQNLFLKFGHDGLIKHLAEVRDNTGKQENIAVLFFHGNEDPLVAGVIDGGDGKPRGKKLGGGQELLDAFLDEAEKTGRKFDRVIVNACNPKHASLEIKKPGIILNYPTGMLGGAYYSEVVEKKIGEQDRVIDGKGKVHLLTERGMRSFNIFEGTGINYNE